MPFLRAFACVLVTKEESANDFAQDALVLALKNWRKFRPGTNLKAWLFTILRNKIYTDQRRAWRQMPWDPELIEATEGAPEPQYYAQLLSEVEALMEDLPPAQRKGLSLLADGYSYGEAARIARTKEGTMKSRVFRARRELKARVEGHTTA